MNYAKRFQYRHWANNLTAMESTGMALGGNMAMLNDETNLGERDTLWNHQGIGYIPAILSRKTLLGEN